MPPARLANHGGQGNPPEIQLGKILDFPLEEVISDLSKGSSLRNNTDTGRSSYAVYAPDHLTHNITQTTGYTGIDGRVMVCVWGESWRVGSHRSESDQTKTSKQIREVPAGYQGSGCKSMHRCSCLLIKITVVSSRATAGLVAIVVGGTRTDRGAAAPPQTTTAPPAWRVPTGGIVWDARHAGRHGGWVEAMVWAGVGSWGRRHRRAPRPRLICGLEDIIEVPMYDDRVGNRHGRRGGVRPSRSDVPDPAPVPAREGYNDEGGGGGGGGWLFGWWGGGGGPTPAQ